MAKNQAFTTHGLNAWIKSEAFPKPRSSPSPLSQMLRPFSKTTAQAAGVQQVKLALVRNGFGEIQLANLEVVGTSGNGKFYGISPTFMAS